MPHRAFILVLACLGLSALAEAEGPRLKLPDFTCLQGKATESVDITIGSLPFRLASWLSDDHDPESAEVKSTLEGLRSVSVRHYAFDSDFVYPKADIDAVRSQLSAPGWSQIAHVRDRKASEDLDVYMALENKKITGLVIVASEPREFTIVNVVGSLDLEQVAKLRKRFEPHSEVDPAPEEPAADL